MSLLSRLASQFSAQVHGLLLLGFGNIQWKGRLGPWCAQTLAGFSLPRAPKAKSTVQS